ncbi:MAG: DUF4340 domain-containing protein [Lachnospiraceae bacterium]|nr:DUF4340 domain-containing protein [Lachnospiraceae bacterium]
MRKQKIQFIVLLAVLAALLSSLLLIRAWNRKEDAAKEEETIRLINLDASAVSGITVYDPTEGKAASIQDMRYDLLRSSDDGSWFVSDDWTKSSLPTAKGDTVSEMLDAVVQLTGSNRIEAVSDLSQYGLVQPSLRIVLKTKGNAGDTVIEIGDLSTAASMYYARVYPDGEESGDVYLITTLVKSLYDVQPDTLIASDTDTGS